MSVDSETKYAIKAADTSALYINYVMLAGSIFGANMSDFSDIDGGEEPLFAEYEDEDLADPPPLPPPLAILSPTERDPGSLDNIGAGDDDDGGLNFDQPFDTSINESHDQSSSAATAAKKRKPILTFNEGR